MKEMSKISKLGSVDVKTFYQPLDIRRGMARDNDLPLSEFPNYLTLVLPVCKHTRPWKLLAERGYETYEEAEAGHREFVEAWDNDNQPEYCEDCIANGAHLMQRG